MEIVIACEAGASLTICQDVSEIVNCGSLLRQGKCCPADDLPTVGTWDTLSPVQAPPRSGPPSDTPPPTPLDGITGGCD